MTCRGENCSVLHLFEERIPQPYLSIGDWNAFLGKRVQSSWKLPMLDRVFTDYQEALLAVFKGIYAGRA
ncbi:MAG: hypothetical protein AAB691_04680 [Patescibacteria group bacterium]